MIRRPNNTNRNKGFTVIELVVVIALLGLLLYFFLGNRETAERGVNVKAMSDQVMNLKETVKSTYKFNYASLTAANFIASRNAPTDMVQGTSLIHAEQGAVTLAPANCSGGTNNCFTLALANVHGSTCSQMVSNTQTQAFAINVGSTAVKSGSVAFDQGTANSACNNDANTVTYTFL